MRPRPRLREVLAALPSVALLLVRLRRLHPHRDLAGLVSAATPGPHARPIDDRRARVALRVARALVQRLPRLFPQPCLYWSLAAYHFLRRAGQAPVVHVGIAAEGRELLSHAWVTVDGEWIAGQPHPARYREVISLP